MAKTQIKKLMEDIYQTNVNNGFYDNPGEFGTRIALVHSELSEALEADRKNKYADFKMYEAYIKEGFQFEGQEKMAFERYIKDTVEDELADAVIRLFDMAEYRGIDLERHIKLKLEYNKTRGHKHGGKAY